MNNTIKRTWNQGSMVNIEDLRGMTFQAESGGHTFVISAVDADGNAVAMSGTPAGTMLRPDNTDQALTCSISGGNVYATLPAGCYDVPGRAGITIFLTSGGQKAAIYAAVVSVTRTQSGTASPGTTASVVDLINAINTAISGIPATDTALKAAMAPTYSNSALYAVGDYAWYNGTLYRCTTAITTAETWTSGHWTTAAIGTDSANELRGLKSALYEYGFDYGGLPANHMSLFEKTENLFSDFCNKLYHSYYKASVYNSTGVIQIINTADFNGWLIRVKPNTIYTCGPLDWRITFWSMDLKYVGLVHENAPLSNTNPNTFTTPDNACWMALTQSSSRDMSEWMMVEGNSYPSTFVSGFPRLVGIPKMPSDVRIARMAVTYGNEITVTYNSSSEAVVTIPNNTVIVTLNGTKTVSTGKTLTLTSANFISYVEEDDDWITGVNRTGKTVYCIGWVDPNSQTSYISGRYTETSATNTVRELGYLFTNTLPKISYSNGTATISIPSCNMEYSGGIVSVSAGEFTLSTPNWLCYDLTAGSLHIGQSVAGHKLIMLGVIHNTKYDASWIAGTKLQIVKTIAFMGDSIVAGSGTYKCFHQYLSERYGWICKNYGYGGSGYVQSYQGTGGKVGQGNEGRGVNITDETKFTPNNVLARLSEVPNTVDGIVIFAGTNDWGAGSAISFSDFVNGVDAVYDYIQTNFGLIPVLVMTPIHRKNDTVPNGTTGKTLKDYADAIIEECRKYGIPCIDTFGQSGLHPDNEGNDVAYFTLDGDDHSDGLHPNHFAHERIMRCIGETLNGMIKYNDTCER